MLGLDISGLADICLDIVKLNGRQPLGSGVFVCGFRLASGAGRHKEFPFSLTNRKVAIHGLMNEISLSLAGGTSQDVGQNRKRIFTGIRWELLSGQFGRRRQKISQTDRM